VDLRLLQIFCAVFEEGSVSGAARRLELSQPTVSEHLKNLEDQVGVPLFDRLSRQIQPTRAGEHLYDQARRVGELERSIVASLGRFLNKLEGRLVLGASSVPGEYLLPALLGRFRGKHPGVAVSLRIKDSREILDELAAGRLDLAFVGARPPSGPLESAPFGTDHLILAVPRGTPWDALEAVSLADLRSLPLVLRPPGSGTRSAFESLLDHHGFRLADFQVIAELGSATAIKEAIKAGVGASVVSDLSIVTEQAAGVIRAVAWREVSAPRRDFFVVTDPRRHASPLVEELLAMIDTGAG
jgi:DNA-binding transcriptional LysR family regulator